MREPRAGALDAGLPRTGARSRPAAWARLAGLVVSLLTALALVGPASAASHKILVLPVDGTADPAIRAKLTAQIVKLAKNLDGQVSTAEATFADTALAVGCDPQAPGCSEQVIATLAVDELVWATATKEGGQIKLVVRHATKGAATRDVATTIAPGDPPERIDAGMSPLFGPAGTSPEPTAPKPVGRPVAPPPSTPAAPPPHTGEGARRPIASPITSPGSIDDDHDRTVGIAFTAGGGVALVLGLALWASYSSRQDSIDRHPTNDRGDFDDLIALEDRAAPYAIAGDCLVIAGLAAGGFGAYYLYRNSHRQRVAVTPAPIGKGAGLTLTILGGL